MFKIEIRGTNRVRNSLRRLASQNPSVVQEVGNDIVKKSLALLKKQKYPPRRGAYVRTGELGRKWRMENKRDGVWAITNKASYRGRFYADYVVGKGQAWMHRGRWWLARDVIKEQMKGFVKALTEKMLEIWGD